jgi:hypothetical protein
LDLIPSILDSDGSSSEYRKNWAGLIQKSSEVDPLGCPKCSGKMQIINIIENQGVTKKILKHSGPWEIKELAAPRKHGNSAQYSYQIDASGDHWRDWGSARRCSFSDEDPGISIDSPRSPDLWSGQGIIQMTGI